MLIKTPALVHVFKLSKFRDTAFPLEMLMLIINKIKGSNKTAPSLDEYRMLQTVQIDTIFLEDMCSSDMRLSDIEYQPNKCTQNVYFRKVQIRKL